jgi:bifunctional UDP-N-acetylglucosamine pyrophosphorylase/glucosamine-1-phosphate N-acetyltransferase
MALVEHVVQAARAVAPPERIVVVTGHQAEAVEELLKPYGVEYVRQVEQLGTGHAVLCAQHKLVEKDAPQNSLLMVLYGDTPLLSPVTLRQLREAQAASNAAATLITTTLQDPTGYGRVILNGKGDVEAVVEQKAATPYQLAVKLINSGIYCFRSSLFWKHVGEIKPNASSGELYLTDMAEILNRNSHVVQQLHIADPSELLGINTRIELSDADRILRARKTRELMIAGVSIERPETVTIDAHVRVGADTMVESQVRLLGHTAVGQNCLIGQGAILNNAILADHVTVAPYTLISDSRVDPEAEVGPFARLRMQAQVGPRAKVGNFVELKKTRLGAESKSQHLAYLGDSEIGDHVNIGAGTITCNFDGENKHVTRIGPGSFIGSNSTLVAPLEVGDGSYVAAGSVITHEVPQGALAVGRSRQENKDGWVAKRKSKKKRTEA